MSTLQCFVTGKQNVESACHPRRPQGVSREKQELNGYPMCGICGKLNFDQSASVDPALIRAMLGAIRHRGPDDEGLYVAPQVGLGHRRLAIIDLNTGHQPLSNEDGTVWIVFNGEIYNYQELRSFLLTRVTFSRPRLIRK